jgi:hypothetical protein
MPKTKKRSLQKQRAVDRRRKQEKVKTVKCMLSFCYTNFNFALSHVRTYFPTLLAEEDPLVYYFIFYLHFLKKSMWMHFDEWHLPTPKFGSKVKSPGHSDFIYNVTCHKMKVNIPADFKFYMWMHLEFYFQHPFW